MIANKCSELRSWSRILAKLLLPASAIVMWTIQMASFFGTFRAMKKYCTYRLSRTVNIFFNFVELLCHNNFVIHIWFSQLIYLSQLMVFHLTIFHPLVLSISLEDMFPIFSEHNQHILLFYNPTWVTLNYFMIRLCGISIPYICFISQLIINNFPSNTW